MNRTGNSRRWSPAWSAPLWQALLESFGLGLGFVFALTRSIGVLPAYAFSSGFLLLCGGCGLWVVLRARLPQGSWRQQALWELAASLLVSLTMVGLQAVTVPLGWSAVWEQSNLGTGLLITLLLLCTGPGYLLARGGARFWRFWDRLRRRRMLWALTHALLSVVVLVAALGAIGLFIISPYSGTAAETQAAVTSPLSRLLARVIVSLFPSTAVMVALTLMALTVVLPPAALFSLIVARRTTQRLERLAAAAGALRRGDYSARVPVQGEDELAQLQADFNAMAEELERTLKALQAERDRTAALLQSRRELIAAVSHELRTPVATVRATLESALAGWGEERSPAALRRDLEVMESEITRLQRLIDDLFTLARTEAGGLTLDCRPTDIGPLVQEITAAVAPLAWQSGRVEVVAELPPDLPPACVDGERLKQVLVNLLRNGVRHTPPGGIVVAAVVAEPELLRLEVRDTGAGIPPEELLRIWERFYRGTQPATDDGSGAGLGLALVKELTEAMGGTVAVESTVGQGSCFTVRLPRV